MSVDDNLRSEKILEMGESPQHFSWVVEYHVVNLSGGGSVAAALAAAAAGGKDLQTTAQVIRCGRKDTDTTSAWSVSHVNQSIGATRRGRERMKC